jgi:hypothetical protein
VRPRARVEADARNAGLTLLFRKPVDIDEFLRVLTDHCRARMFN